MRIENTSFWPEPWWLFRMLLSKSVCGRTNYIICESLKLSQVGITFFQTAVLKTWWCSSSLLWSPSGSEPRLILLLLVFLTASSSFQLAFSFPYTLSVVQGSTVCSNSGRWKSVGHGGPPTDWPMSARACAPALMQCASIFQRLNKPKTPLIQLNGSSPSVSLIFLYILL